MRKGRELGHWVGAQFDSVGDGATWCYGPYDAMKGGIVVSLREGDEFTC